MHACMHVCMFGMCSALRLVVSGRAESVGFLFMIEHGLEDMRTCLEACEADQGQSDQFFMQLDGVELFGRGRIDRLIAQCVDEVQQACNLTEAIAKTKLKQTRWIVVECIEKY